jgi:hypothetical protein
MESTQPFRSAAGTAGRHPIANGTIGRLPMRQDIPEHRISVATFWRRFAVGVRQGITYM